MNGNVSRLRMLQALPLDVKVSKSLIAIERFIQEYGHESIYTAFSGGKDSRVLYYLVRQVEKRIPPVFCNTKLEFPELVQSVLTVPGVQIIEPEMWVADVITKYGYPVVSKKIAGTIYKLRHHNLSDKYKNYLLNGDERGRTGMLSKQWQYLVDGVDYEISDKCCEIMKKRPFKKYVKESGRFAFFTGELAEESRYREQQYLKFGCNAFERKSGPKSTPLGFWREQDLLQFLIANQHEPLLRLPEVYGEFAIDNGEIYLTGVPRTGCIFCPLGACRKGDKRFLLLKKSHPEIYDYCMRGGKYNEKGMWVPHQGLGMKHVLETLKVVDF